MVRVPGNRLSFSCDWTWGPSNEARASSGQGPPQAQGFWLLRVSLWGLGVSHCCSPSACASPPRFSALASSMSEDGHLPVPELTLPQFKPSEEPEEPHKVEIPNWETGANGSSLSQRFAPLPLSHSWQSETGQLNMAARARSSGVQGLESSQTVARHTLFLSVRIKKEAERKYKLSFYSVSGALASILKQRVSSLESL